MICKQGSLWVAACTAVALLVVLCAAAAVAQELSGGAEWAEMSNRYIYAQLGVSGTVKPTSDTEWDIPGRWLVGTAEGDPETTADNRHALVYFPRNLATTVPCEYFGFLKVKVGDKVKMVGDSNAGYWSRTPYAYTTPPPGYGLGKTGGYIDAEWTVTDGSAALAKLRIRMSLVRDLCRFEFTLVNSAAVAQSIGLQMTADVFVDENSTSGFSYVPGYGYTYSSAVANKPYPVLVTGNSVPAYLDTYDSVESPAVVARNVLREQDCTSPDALVLAEFGELASGSNWMPDDFAPDYMMPINNLAWAVTWQPKALGAGASRKIVTYYGVGAASSVWTYRAGSRTQQDHVCLAVQGPRSLQYDSTLLGTNDLDPSPFTIKAYLYNLASDTGPYDLDDVTVTLYLPAGLELASTTTQSAQQSIGRVPVNSEALPASWTVQATGEYCGELEYFVTARASSGWQQVVSRKIIVPATKRLVLRSGWQMIHVPFTFNNPAIEHAFGLPRGSFAAKYYNPATGQYYTVDQLVPGKAFWMYVSNVQTGKTQSHKLVADAAIIGEDFGKQAREQYVNLDPGWNLVGNPFVYPVYWGQVQVYSRISNTTVTLDQAAKNGWLSKTVFAWVPGSTVYDNFKDSDKLLLPWRGYWVRAKYPITLVFRPSVPPASDVTTKPGGF